MGRFSGDIPRAFHFLPVTEVTAAEAEIRHASKPIKEALLKEESSYRASIYGQPQTTVHQGNILGMRSRASLQILRVTLAAYLPRFLRHKPEDLAHYREYVLVQFQLNTDDIPGLMGILHVTQQVKDGFSGRHNQSVAEEFHDLLEIEKARFGPMWVTSPETGSLPLSKDGTTILNYLQHYEKQYGYGDHYSGARTIGNILKEFQGEIQDRDVWQEIQYLVDAGYVCRNANLHEQLDMAHYLKVSTRGRGALMSEQQKPNQTVNNSTIHIGGSNHAPIVGIGNQNNQNNADAHALQLLAELAKPLILNASERSAKKFLESVSEKKTADENQALLAEAVELSPTLKDKFLGVLKTVGTSVTAGVVVQGLVALAKAKGWM